MANTKSTDLLIVSRGTSGQTTFKTTVGDVLSSSGNIIIGGEGSKKGIDLTKAIDRDWETAGPYF